jgi:hypothetical protein
MAELVVMCPECRLCEAMTHSAATIIDTKGRCKHRQNPTNCAMLAASIAAVGRILEQSERRANKKPRTSDVSMPLRRTANRPAPDRGAGYASESWATSESRERSSKWPSHRIANDLCSKENPRDRKPAGFEAAGLRRRGLARTNPRRWECLFAAAFLN